MNKLILSLIFALLLIPTALALDLNPFATAKLYDDVITEDTNEFLKSDFNYEYGSIKLSKTFFWFESDKIAEYSLTANTKRCVEECEAEGKAVLYSDGKLFDDINFKNLRDNKDTSITEYKYYILQNVSSEIDVPIYTEICDAKSNVTAEQTCSYDITYEKKTIYSMEWIEYKNEELKADNYHWKIKGKKDRSQSVDWIVTARGKELTEWATWTTANCYLGGTITIDGDYCVHTFTSNSSFNITAELTAEVLVVGGGGGGGTNMGGGGGAGGLNHTNITLTPGNKTVNIGGGGLGSVGSADPGASGGNSSFDSIVVRGGGGGGGYDDDGLPGDSGGGGGADIRSGGTGVEGRGHRGGFGTGGGAGGGGGFLANGTNGTGGVLLGVSGNGSYGYNTTINGSLSCFDGGGGGGQQAGVDRKPGYGFCGGGDGGHGADAPGEDATANTGGGGGGSGNWGAGTSGGDGGSGIVIVRYLVVNIMTIELNSPVDRFNTTSTNITFNCSSANQKGNLNATELYIDGVINQTDYGYYDFDGKDDYINLGNSTNYNLTDLNSFTVSFWTKLNEYPTATFVMGLLGTKSGTFNFGSGITTPGALNSGLRNATYSTDSKTSSARWFVLNEWVHTTMRYNSSTKNYTIYRNGVYNNSWILAVTGIGVGNYLYAGSVNSIVSGNGQYFNGSLDEIRIYNKTLTTEEITTTYNYGRNRIGTAPPTDKLVAYYQLDGNSLDVSGNENNGTDSGASGLFNYTLIKNVSGLSEGVHTWTCKGIDADGFSGWATANRTFTIDSTAPVINITYPTNNRIIQYNSAGINFNFSASDSGVGLMNCSFTINNSDYPIEWTNATCGTNVTGIPLIVGDHRIRYRAYDLLGNYRETASNVTVFNWINESYSTSALEGSSQVFHITLNASSNVTISGNLSYNGTNYAGTSSSYSYDYGTTYNKTLTIPIPYTLNTNITFFWNMSLAFNSNTQSFVNSTHDVNVSMFLFGPCNGTTTYQVLNISFIDETTGLQMNATLPSSTWTYNYGSLSKSFTFLNNSHNIEYDFCMYPNYISSFNSNATIQYTHTEIKNYPQRKVTLNNTYVNTSITHKKLYLLESADGLYVTFQVVTASGSGIEGVTATATRLILGETVTVGTGTTGADGGITFWLNPDFEHTFTFSKTGYTTYTTDITPTQSSYTITLGGTSTTNNYDYNRGMSLSIIPLKNYLYNDTTYTFNLSVSSNYWSLSEFGFEMVNSSGFSFGTASQTTNGGIANLNLNTGTNNSFIMNYYWIVNSSYQNFSRSWLIINTNGTSHSVDGFFDRLLSYISDESDSDGLFGLKKSDTNFSLSIILFLIIFTFSGIMSYKFGIASPAAISAIVFSLVFLFDVTLGLLPNPPSSPVPHFLTFFIGIIMTGLIIKEGMQ